MRSTFKPQFAEYTWKAAAVSLQFCADEIKAPAVWMEKHRRHDTPQSLLSGAKNFPALMGKVIT